MIPLTAWAGRKVALFGLGGSGLATAHCLVAGGADVIAFDDNPDAVIKASGEGIAVGDFCTLDWSGIDALVLAPGVPLTHPEPHWSVDLAHAANVPIIGDVALFADERRRVDGAGPFIAITGTNGKSTTTALIAHVLASAGQAVEMGGNIGTPVLELAPPAPDRTHVVECSSYQIDLAPDLGATVGILLNLTPDHLDRHGTMDHYAAVKARLIETCDTAIIGVDDPWCRAIADAAEAHGQSVFRVSVEPEIRVDIHVIGSTIMVKGARIADLDGILTLRGSHNAQNAACAVGVALALGIEAEVIQAGLASFPGLRHRMQPVGRVGKVLFVNDSKATNADAAAHALASFETIYWIAGGRAKSGGIDSLNKFFPKISKAYLIGEAADAFAASLGTVDHEISGSLDRAVAAAARDAEASDAMDPVVLLSPACASFDQYRNFELRGDAFMDAAMQVPGFKTGAG